MIKYSVKVQERGGAQAWIIEKRDATGADAVLEPGVAAFIEDRIQKDPSFGTQVTEIIVYVRTH